MRKLTLFWALVFSVFISFSGTALAASAVYDDLWDVSQGAIVGEHSTVLDYGAPVQSDIRDMFGGTYSPHEPGNMMFGDQETEGFVHYVEWQTPDLVTLQGFKILARHSDPSPNRMFDKFALYYGNGQDNWTKIYNWILPEGETTYGGTPNNLLELEISLNNPVIAKYFRAEFTQAGIYGPRIIELDGYGATGAPVPVPGAVWLLGTGLISLAGIRRRSTML